MASRHLTRQAIVQSLYAWDFNSKNINLQREFDVICDDYGSSIDREFALNILSDLPTRLTEVDIVVDKHCAVGGVTELSIVDRAILRLAVYELEFSSDVPKKVVINEAIELARALSGDNGAKLVAGVLGSIYGPEGAMVNHKKTAT